MKLELKIKPFELVLDEMMLAKVVGALTVWPWVLAEKVTLEVPALKVPEDIVQFPLAFTREAFKVSVPPFKFTSPVTDIA